jgi:ribA/ribD-fused uncharacterized protein
MNRDDRLEVDGTSEDRAIFFYGALGSSRFGCFSNFSRHVVLLSYPTDKRLVKTQAYYPTGEHRFQAMKATSAGDHIAIAQASTPKEAKRLGRSIDLRPGWGDSYGDLCYLVMLEIVMTKARQHSDVMEALKLTGSKFIYEDSPIDDIWGVRKGDDYSGKNLLGLAWMQARYLLLAA